ncbi:MAG: DUF4350 domain-containing protein [Novosphingobium sp.]|uniref:DUF4350 domain-containing protein n=1 Tax=Novosphingobium sp. TaxID=1874826 RepID=UPI0032BC07E8
MSSRSASPFSRGAGALLALAGIIGFVLVLWAMGHAMDQPPTTTQEATSRGRGFDGYAAMAQYLEKRGFKVDPLQDDAMVGESGLLVLTPPHQADLKLLERMVSRHRSVGPTLVITPKWKLMGTPQVVPKGKYKGQLVETLDAKVPQWPGWYDELTLDLYPLSEGPKPGGWQGFGVSGSVPVTEWVISAEGDGLIPLVRDPYTDRVLAGYIADGGDYPALHEAAGDFGYDADTDKGVELYPLVIVFEPDLLNNYGFAKRDSAVLTERLVRAMLGPNNKRIMFDLMLNGYGAPPKGPSLIKQAFKPPFLAATICLILAVMVAFWRALHRFGPALLASRSIAFGKRALVANAAGLIQRARRLHLLGPPYADAARERLIRALALPARLDPHEAELAIDRALAVRAPALEPFSNVAARLRGARRPADLIAAARQLHSLERTLMR